MDYSNYVYGGIILVLVILIFVYWNPKKVESLKNKKNRKTTNKRTCKDKQTSLDVEDNGTIAYLDRHNIQCEDDENMTRLQYVRDGAGNFKYDYRCCK
jgi:FtsZ-interacting cell division protein ZipA